MNEAISELRRALEFVDQVRASPAALKAVGRDHWDWLESAARKVVAVDKSDGYRSRGNTEARKYAAEHGMAVIMLADDSARIFYRDGAKVRQRTIRRENVRWA